MFRSPRGALIAVSAAVVLSPLASPGLARVEAAGVSVTPDPLGLIVPAPAPPASPPVPAPLTDPARPLNAPPFPVPLHLRLPTLDVSADVLAVGLNGRGQMDAPRGAPSDPVWSQVFWYRGGATPGAPGVATVAGHADDSLGRPAVFAHLAGLHPGDSIEMLDKRTGRIMRFHVTQTALYSVGEAGSPVVAGRIFGTSAASGPALLNLITCAGDWQNGDYAKRLVVYAVRDSAMVVPPPRPLLSL
ncbi:MAG: class F sortase [Candidatus Dormibacteria bacterium]